MQDTAAAVKGLAEGESESLKAVLDELQAAVPGGGAVSIATVAAAIRTALVAGGTATTALVVAGIGVGDHIVSVIQLDVAADTGTSATGNKVQNAVDLSGEASITAGHVALSTTNTTGDLLLITWVKTT